MHVLLVDDEPAYRMLVRDALEQAGAVVDEAANAAAALERIRVLTEQGQPFLLLTDYRMTGMDGLALVAEARSVAPCVLMTSHCGRDERAGAESLGIELVMKPASPDDLQDWVQGLLARRQGVPALLA